MAVERAEWLLDRQRSFGAAIEPAVHSWFDARPLLAGSATVFYLVAHLSSVIATGCWLAARHPQAFVRFRWTFALAQVLTVTVYLALPVAPLRMLLAGDADPGGAAWTRSMQYELAAMPSGHVVFALVVGLAVWRDAGRRWRWIAVMHVVCTVVVVVATANHLMVDAVGAVVVTAVATIVVGRVERRRRSADATTSPTSLHASAVR